MSLRFGAFDGAFLHHYYVDDVLSRIARIGFFPKQRRTGQKMREKIASGNDCFWERNPSGVCRRCKSIDFSFWFCAIEDYSIRPVELR
jgi:hypothetical protein